MQKNNKLKQSTIRDLRDKKGFTLIELIVVMAVIAILVLLAAPRFLNKTSEAKITKITNDVKVVENFVDEYLVNHDTLPVAWIEKTDTELQTLATGGLVYDNSGPANTVDLGLYKVVDDDIKKLANTKLKGDFYANDMGKVYYKDDKPVVSDGTESGNDETPIVKVFEDSEISGTIALGIDKHTLINEAKGEFSISLSYSADLKFVEYIATEASGLDTTFPYSQDDWNEFYTYHLRSVEETFDTTQSSALYASVNEHSFEVTNFTQIKKDSIILKIVPERDNLDATEFDSGYVLDTTAASYVEMSNMQAVSSSTISVDVTFMNKNKEVMSTNTMYSYWGFAPYTFNLKDCDGYAAFSVEAIPITPNFSDYSLYVYENTDYDKDYLVSTINNTLGKINYGEFLFDKAAGKIMGYAPSSEASKLDTLVIPSEIDGVTVKSIGDWAFLNKGLISVDIPDTVESIGPYAFSGNKLTEVSLPQSLISIGDYAFGYNLLTEVVIPNTVSIINNGVFSSNKLTTIDIPDAVTYIGAYAFANNSLSSATIGSGITRIRITSFQNNYLTTSLTTINKASGEVIIDAGAFANNGPAKTTTITPTFLK